MANECSCLCTYMSNSVLIYISYKAKHIGVRMKSNKEVNLEKTKKVAKKLVKVKKDELLAVFNEEKVEPINHTRKSLYEEECLSFL